MPTRRRPVGRHAHGLVQPLAMTQPIAAPARKGHTGVRKAQASTAEDPLVVVRAAHRGKDHDGPRIERRGAAALPGGCS